MPPGPVRKMVNYSGKYYSAVGNAADQTVKSTPGLIGVIIISAGATDVVTIKDGSNQVCKFTGSTAVPINVGAQTSIVVNGPATATISVMYT